MAALPLPLLAALAGVFLLFLLAARVRYMATLSVVLLLLLLHQYVLRAAENLLHISDPGLLLISLWKDVGLAALIMVTLWRLLRRAPGFAFRPLISDVALAAWVFLGLVHTAFSPDKLAGLAAFRDYFQPVAFYLLLRWTLFSREDLARLLGSWSALGTAIAVFAIWQGLTWTPDDFVAWGYGAVTGQVGIPYRQVLGRWIIRPPVTFTGPNELALHMIPLSLFSLLLSFTAGWPGRLATLGATSAQWAALLVTTSRSGIAGMLAGLGALTSRWIARWSREREVSIRWWHLSAGGGLAILLALIVVFLSPSVTARIQGAVSRISADYHVQDTLGAMRGLLEAPAGVGMGQVGPRQGFGFPNEFAFHAEGSLFQVAFDMGVWGLLAFLVFLALALRKIWFNWGLLSDPLLKATCGTAFATWIGALVAFAFLPLMQAFPLVAWLWSLLGLGMSADRIGAVWERASDRDIAAESVSPNTARIP